MIQQELHLQVQQLIDLQYLKNDHKYMLIQVLNLPFQIKFSRETRISSINSNTSKTGIGTDIIIYLSIKSRVAVRFPINPATFKECVLTFSHKDAAIRFAANNSLNPLICDNQIVISVI